MLMHFKEHKNDVNQIALYEDNIHIATCSRDRTFIVWDLKAQKSVCNYRQKMGGINDITISKEQDLIVTVGQEKSIT